MAIRSKLLSSSFGNNPKIHWVVYIHDSSYSSWKIIYFGKNKSSIVPIGKCLREEIGYWTFLDYWTAPFAWLPERHFTVKFSSYSSICKWGVVYHSGVSDITFSDYWSDEQKSFPIMLKEALA